MKSAARAAALFLSLVSVLHVLRFIFQPPVTVGEIEIPMWASGFAVIGAGALAVWLWKELRL